MPDAFQLPQTASAFGPHWADFAFFLVWIPLLIHCLARPLYPVFGRGARTRLVWLASFFLFNPLQLVLYFVFGVLASRRGRAERTARTWVTATVAVLLVSIAIFFNVPSPAGDGEPFTVHRGSDGQLTVPDRDGIGLDLNWSESRSSYQASSFVGSNDFGAVPCRTIAVLNHAPDAFAERVGRAFAVELAKRCDAVREVTYYPHGKMPPPGERLADLFVHLDLESMSMTRLPMSRATDVRVNVSVAHRIVTSRWNAKIPDYPAIYDPRIQLGYRCSIRNLVLDAGSSKFNSEVGTLAAGAAKPIAECLNQMIDDYGSVPRLPAACDGAFTPVSMPDTLARYEPRMIASGPAVFRTNRTVWAFDSNDAPETVLNDVAERLVAAGWRAGVGSAILRRFTQGRAHLDVFRDAGADHARRARTRYFVRYEMPLAPADVDRVRAAVRGDATVPLRVALLLAKPIPELANDLDASAIARAETPRELLQLARIFRRTKRLGEAREAVVRAVQLGTLTMAGGKKGGKKDARELATALGDPSLADAPVDLAACRALGFESLVEPREVVLEIDGSARFFVADGDSHGIAIVRPCYGAGGLTLDCQLGRVAGERVEQRARLRTSRSRLQAPITQNVSIVVDVSAQPDGTIVLHAKRR